MTTDAENNRPDAVESAGGYRNWSLCPGLLSFYTVWNRWPSNVTYLSPGAPTPEGLLAPVFPTNIDI